MKKLLALGVLVLALSSCQSTDAPKNKETEQKQTVDINNTEEVLNFAYENYVSTTQMETPITEEAFKTEGTCKTLIADLNSDGTEDILLYSPLDVNSQFDVVSAITVKDGAFVIMPSDIENVIDYGQAFSFEDNLLIRNLHTGGTDVNVNYAFVYIPKTDKLYSTTQPIFSGGQTSFQEQTIIIDVTKSGTWDKFTLVSKATIKEENKVAVNDEAEYTLDREKNAYTMVVKNSFYIADVEYVYPREKVSEAEFPNSEFHKRVPTASYSEYIESNEHRLLTGLTNETFGQQNIDYASQLAVIIPRYDSVNAPYTEKRTISFEGDYINELKVTIFGELEDVKVLSYKNYEDQNPTEIDLGNLTNTELTINAPFPNDSSRVDVVGQFYLGEGTYEEVRVPLSPLGNLEESKVITY